MWAALLPFCQLSIFLGLAAATELSRLPNSGALPGPNRQYGKLTWQLKTGRSLTLFAAGFLAGGALLRGYWEGGGLGGTNRVVVAGFGGYVVMGVGGRVVGG